MSCVTLRKFGRKQQKNVLSLNYPRILNVMLANIEHVTFTNKHNIHVKDKNYNMIFKSKQALTMWRLLVKQNLHIKCYNFTNNKVAFVIHCFMKLIVLFLYQV